MSQAVSSFPHLVTSAPADAASHLSAVEARFVQNWAGLARAFGMDPLLGRLHAVAFLSAGPVRAGKVAEVLGVSVEQAAHGLDSLVDWGVLREVGDGDRDADRCFEAEGDPWCFFLVTLRERGRREFGPLVAAIREANAAARALRRNLPQGAQAEQRRIDRIHSFSDFVEQIAGLLETFASLGAGPLMGALRMASRVRAPRLLRI
jgi:DNA-binding transcriptional regulator GbsR (MarR family)